MRVHPVGVHPHLGISPASNSKATGCTGIPWMFYNVHARSLQALVSNDNNKIISWLIGPASL